MPSVFNLHTRTEIKPPSLLTFPRKALEMQTYIILVLLVAAGFKFTQSLNSSIDIYLFDESSYLDAGYNLFTNGFPAAENGPLYALWYKILSLIEPNKISLYFLNYKVTTILVSVALFAVLRTYRVSNIVSFIASLWLLICRGNISAWPRVEHPALVLLLLSLVLIKNVKSSSTALLVCSFISLLASYVHPEYFLACLLLFGLYLVVAIIRRAEANNKAILVLFLSASLILLVLLGPPAFFSSGKRNFIAFGQHYALNWTRWKHSDIPPMINWRPIMKQDFGEADSFLSAVWINPSAVMKHVMSNTLQSSIEIPRFFSVRIFSIFQERSTFIFAQIIVLSFTACVYALKRRKAWIEQVRLNLKLLKLQFTVIGVYIFVLLIVCIFIFPRNHYILVLATLLFVSIFLCFAANQKEHSSAFINVLVCTLLFLIVPEFDLKERQQTLKMLRFIERLGIKKNVNLLESDGGYSIYLPRNYRSVLAYWKTNGFNEFHDKNRINMILVSSSINEDMSYKSDSEWISFQKNPEKSGYRRVKIVGSSSILLVHHSLLNDVEPSYPDRNLEIIAHSP